MQKRGEEILYSASDLVNYLECEHLTTLDLVDLETPLPKTEDSDQAKLIQAKGYAHEADFLELLKALHPSLIDIAATGGTLEQKVANTLQAMHEGYEIIFQATLRDGCLIGHADFLRKVPRPSELGDWSYEVLDTKLARSTKAKFIIQLGFYSALVGKGQGLPPLQMHVVLGDRTEAAYRYADYARYLTIPAERGIFLGTTWRMHPDVCRFISDAVYDGRLEPEPNNVNQTLLLSHDAHPALMTLTPVAPER